MADFNGVLPPGIQSISSLEQLHAIVFYLMGRIPSLSYTAIGSLATIIGLAVLLLFTMTRDFNAMSLGEEGEE